MNSGEYLMDAANVVAIDLAVDLETLVPEKQSKEEILIQMIGAMRTVSVSKLHDWRNKYPLVTLKPELEAINVAKILEGAAEILEKYGWIQNSLANNQGYCAIGAIRQSAINNQNVNYFEEYGLALASRYLFKYMTKHDYFLNCNVLAIKVCNVPAIEVWNDTQGREKFEVIELLRQASKEWRTENAE